MPSPEHDHPDVMHEGRDVSWPVVLGTTAGLVVSAIVIYIVCWVTFRFFERRSNTINAELARSQPVAAQEGQKPLYDRILSVPPPRLEPLQPIPNSDPYSQYNQPERAWSPRVRPEDLHADRQQRLQSYGWVDRKQEIIHIPVARAMEILVQSHQLDAKGEKKP